MVNPLVFVALVAGKKAAAYAAYRAVHAYGVPRLYRRLLEVNRGHTPAASRTRVQALVRASIIFPSRLVALLEDKHGALLYRTAVEMIKGVGRAAAPPGAGSGRGGGGAGAAASGPPPSQQQLLPAHPPSTPPSPLVVRAVLRPLARALGDVGGSARDAFLAALEKEVVHGGSSASASAAATAARGSSVATKGAVR